jgi:transposase
LVDTEGFVLEAIVHAADLQDRDGGVLLLTTLFGLFPFLRKLYADAGYQGPKFQNALKRVLRRVKLEIVKRSDAANGFVVLPKRWIVERTIGWLNRCRRLAKDWENLNRKALAFLHLASIRLMVRRVCKTCELPGQTLILQLSFLIRPPHICGFDGLRMVDVGGSRECVSLA